MCLLIIQVYCHVSLCHCMISPRRSSLNVGCCSRNDATSRTRRPESSRKLPFFVTRNARCHVTNTFLCIKANIKPQTHYTARWNSSDWNVHTLVFRLLTPFSYKWVEEHTASSLLLCLFVVYLMTLVPHSF